MTAGPLDLVIKNVRLVRPRQPTVEPMDLGVKDGRFARIEREIPTKDALQIFDPDQSFTVRAADSPSAQGYTPFEGQQLTGKVAATFLRGGARLRAREDRGARPWPLRAPTLGARTLFFSEGEGGVRVDPSSSS